MINRHTAKLKQSLTFLITGLLIWQMSVDQLHAQGRSDSIAETGQNAPDRNGRFNRFFNPTLNKSGTVAFSASLTGTFGGASDDSGIFRGSGGFRTQIAREGEAAPDGNGTFSSVGDPILNNSGTIAFFGNVIGTSDGAADDRGIFHGSGGSLTQIARRGGAAPDGNGTFHDLGSTPVLNDLGMVAFSSRLSGTSGGAADNTGIFGGDNGAVIRIVRSGTAASDGNGTFSSVLGRTALNDLGTIAFLGGLTGTSGGRTDDTGIFRANNGSITQIAREGRAAPDGNGLFSEFGFGPAAMNASGMTAFCAGLSGTSGGFTDDKGIFRGSGGSLIQIVRTGDSVPDGNGSFTAFAPPVINNSGTIAFRGDLTGTSGGSSDEIGIFRSSGGSLTQIARTGEAVPDGNGRFSLLDVPAINNSGTTAFLASLTGTSGGSAENSGVYLADGIDTLQVVRKGDLLSGSAVVSVSLSTDSTRSGLNDHGQVAYHVRLTDGREMIRRFTPDLHWRSTASSAWDTSSHWTLGLSPGEVHDVFIDPDASLTVAGPNRDVAVKSLIIGSASSSGLATLNLTSGSTITASTGVGVFSNGVLTGDGTINGIVFNRGTVVADNLNFENGGLLIDEGSLEGTGRVNGNINNGANGNIRANNGNALRLTGSTLTNRGRIEVIVGDLEVSANVDNVAGTGLITGRDATIRFNGGVTNQGAIAITDGINDVFGDIENTGAISVGGDAEAIFYDDITQNGSFEVTAFGSRTAAAIVLGEFTGSGGFTGGGDVFLLGDLRPGNSPASVLMDGNLFLGATTISEFEFESVQPGEFDQLLVTGDLNLAGELAVSLLGGFEFSFNQELIIADVGGDLFGQFAGFGEGDLVGNFVGQDLFISYSAGDGNDVSFFTAVPEPSTGTAALLALIGLFLRRLRLRR